MRSRIMYVNDIQHVVMWLMHINDMLTASLQHLSCRMKAQSHRVLQAGA